MYYNKVLGRISVNDLNKKKYIIDILQIIILIMLMLGNYTGVLIHEILGISLIILFVIHHLINKEYYKNIFKGKHNNLRKIYLFIDVFMIIMFIMMFISMFMISQKLFIFINLSNDYYGRILHIISSYSLYILCAVHLGLHYNFIFKFKENIKIIINIFLILIGLIFGINAFIKRKFIMKLSLKLLYPVYFNDNIIVSIIDYLSIFILFIMIGYGIFNIVKITRKKEIK